MRHWGPLDVVPEILADIPDLVFVYACDGRYLYINAAASAFLDTDPLDVIGYHWRELGYSPDVMLPLTQRVATVAESGTPEHYRVTSSRERGLKTFDMSLTPLWSEEGRVLAVLAIAHDISEFFETA